MELKFIKYGIMWYYVVHRLQQALKIVPGILGFITWSQCAYRNVWLVCVQLNVWSHQTMISNLSVWYMRHLHKYIPWRIHTLLFLLMLFWLDFYPLCTNSPLEQPYRCPNASNVIVNSMGTEGLFQTNYKNTPRTKIYNFLDVLYAFHSKRYTKYLSKL